MITNQLLYQLSYTGFFGRNGLRAAIDDTNKMTKACASGGFIVCVSRGPHISSRIPVVVRLAAVKAFSQAKTALSKAGSEKSLNPQR